MLDILPITFESQGEVDGDPGVNKVSEAHHREILFSLSIEEFAPLSIENQSQKHKSTGELIKSNLKVELLTGNTNEKESTGSAPDLQEVDRPSKIRSKRPMNGLSLTSSSATDGTRSNKR